MSSREGSGRNRIATCDVVHIGAALVHTKVPVRSYAAERVLYRLARRPKPDRMPS